MRALLEKTRAINKLLQKSAGHNVDFNEVAEVLSENIGASIYILDRKGRVSVTPISKAGPVIL